jgi:putative addiction module killer protein
VQALFGLDHVAGGEAVLAASVLSEFDQIGRAAHRAHHGVELVDPVAGRVRMTETFAVWLHDLHEAKARAKIAVRIQRLANGNPGDVAPVGEGVSEMRIHHGPGYRLYYAARGAELLILLCGGDKATQARHIEAA